MDKERAQQKVQKLMALAKNGGANEGEADNALRQAEALMRKFGIEETDLSVAQAAAITFDWGTEFAPYGIARQPAKSVPQWYQYVATGVATFTDTIVKRHYKPELGYGVGFYGERSDVIFAVWLVTYLRDTVWRVVAKQKDLERYQRNSFRDAMACRLSARMRSLREERNEVFAAAGTGTSLVVVDRKLEERNEQFGAPSYKSRKLVVKDHGAAERGRTAGNEVGFNRVIGGTTQSQLN